MCIGQHRSHMPQVCNPTGQQTFWLFLFHSLQRCLPPSVQVSHFVGQLPSCEQSTQTRLTSFAWPHLPDIQKISKSIANASINSRHAASVRHSRCVARSSARKHFAAQCNCRACACNISEGTRWGSGPSAEHSLGRPTDQPIIHDEVVARARSTLWASQHPKEHRPTSAPQSKDGVLSGPQGMSRGFTLVVLTRHAVLLAPHGKLTNANER